MVVIKGFMPRSIMKNLKVILCAALLVLASAESSLHAKRVTTKRVEAVVQQVDKEMSLLDQIIKQANAAVDGTTHRVRLHAKKELIKLMNNKDLDTQIKDAIKDDIEIIKTAKTKSELKAARTRLLNIYAQINAQANVVDTIAEATKMV